MPTWAMRVTARARPAARATRASRARLLVMHLLVGAAPRPSASKGTSADKHARATLTAPAQGHPVICPEYPCHIGAALHYVLAARCVPFGDDSKMEVREASCCPTKIVLTSDIVAIIFWQFWSRNRPVASQGSILGFRGPFLLNLRRKMRLVNIQ